MTIESFQNQIKLGNSTVQDQPTLTQRYDSIWFVRSFTYKQQGGGGFIEEFLGDYEGMRKHENKDEETKQNKNIIQIKFNNIIPIHQTNAN